MTTESCKASCERQGERKLTRSLKGRDQKDWDQAKAGVDREKERDKKDRRTEDEGEEGIDRRALLYF